MGPYELLAAIGAGGMGEVYRAKDTRLDRDVAVKILPAAVAQDPERVMRFEREAKVLASLNHPNIAHVYGVEENGAVRALVMELVQGSTISVPQQVDTALHYGRQIAEALEAAHEKGIVHRDLKPANIMVTREGIVKVLDFGLAAVPAAPANGDPASSPTVTLAATQVGTIMGTAGYMSPEQASGKIVDKRSDIWSFGVVMWEMLTGEQLFRGETASQIVADVLRTPIDFSKLPDSTPPRIVQLKRIDIAGGAVVTLCATEGSTYAASWSSRGVILFPDSATSGLYRIPATGALPCQQQRLTRRQGKSPTA